MSAIRDDVVQWEAFCSLTGADVRWKLYSREYAHARELHTKYGYTDRELRLAVQHAIQRDDLTKTQLDEWKELQHFMTLEKKYQ